LGLKGQPVDRRGTCQTWFVRGLWRLGAEYTLTVNDREKYATYTRDSVSGGLDYAVNRYYASNWGRFMTPDLYGRSANLWDPQSWNRYMYTLGDPINRADQRGYCSDDGSGDDNSGDGSGTTTAAITRAATIARTRTAGPTGTAALRMMGHPGAGPVQGPAAVRKAATSPGKATTRLTWSGDPGEPR